MCVSCSSLCRTSGPSIGPNCVRLGIRLLVKTPPRKRSIYRTRGRLARALDITGRLRMGCRGPCFIHAPGLALLQSSHPTHRNNNTWSHSKVTWPCSFAREFKLISCRHTVLSVKGTHRGSEGWTAGVSWVPSHPCQNRRYHCLLPHPLNPQWNRWPPGDSMRPPACWGELH